MAREATEDRAGERLAQKRDLVLWDGRDTAARNDVSDELADSDPPTVELNRLVLSQRLAFP
jgi:hypothetical protein